MKAFFDTSVLVATFHGDHEHHERSLSVFLKFRREDAAASAHSLAEVYATMTALPGKHRVSPDQVTLFLETMRHRLTLIALTKEDYWEIIEAASQQRLVGGAIYDALLAGCALKSKAETIFTWNVRDFARLGPEVSKRVRTP